MSEYIVSCSRDLPKECVDCSPCLRFGCEHVSVQTARPREEIIRCKDCQHCYPFLLGG